MARKKEKKELENKNQEETKVEITVEPTEEIEQSSEESVEIEEDKNIEETVEPSVSEEQEEDTVEPTEISFSELENMEPIEKEIISLDNSPISPLIQEEKEIIPEKFVNVTPKKVEHENKINIKNKRVYKDLGNGYGMYSDDGSIFKI